MDSAEEKIEKGKTYLLGIGSGRQLAVYDKGYGLCVDLVDRNGKTIPLAYFDDNDELGEDAVLTMYTYDDIWDDESTKKTKFYHETLELYEEKEQQGESS